MFIPIAENLPKKDALYHKGIVVDNKDPKNLGRIKALVEGRYQVASNNYDRLPWIFPNNTGRTGGRIDSGSFSVPEIRSEVKVTFLNDDPYTAVYEGTWETEDLHAEELWEDESCYGWIDSIIQWFIVNKNRRLNQFFRAITGDLVELNESGDVRINISGSLLLNVDQDIKITAQKRVESYRDVEYATDKYSATSSDYSIRVGGPYYRSCNEANLLPATPPSRAEARNLTEIEALYSEVSEMLGRIGELRETASSIKERANELNVDILETGIPGEHDGPLNPYYRGDLEDEELGEQAREEQEERARIDQRGRDQREQMRRDQRERRERERLDQERRDQESEAERVRQDENARLDQERRDQENRDREQREQEQ